MAFRSVTGGQPQDALCPAAGEVLAAHFAEQPVGDAAVPRRTDRHCADRGGSRRPRRLLARVVRLLGAGRALLLCDDCTEQSVPGFLRLGVASCATSVAEAPPDAVS